MLELKNLCVDVDGTEILHNVNMTVNTGETHVLFGPNGSGKTTLLMTIMGFPKYKVTKGSISFNGKDITRVPLDERARQGIGMSFQRPPIVRGVKTEDVVHATLRDRDSEAEIQNLALQSGRQGPSASTSGTATSGVTSSAMSSGTETSAGASASVMASPASWVPLSLELLHPTSASISERTRHS